MSFFDATSFFDGLKPLLTACHCYFYSSLVYIQKFDTYNKGSACPYCITILFSKTVYCFWNFR